VIGSDEEDIACFLASFVDCPDGGIGGSNGFDSGVVDTCVANLVESCKTSKFVDGLYTKRTISGGAKLHMTNSYF